MYHIYIPFVHNLRAHMKNGTVTMKRTTQKNTSLKIDFVIMGHDLHEGITYNETSFPSNAHPLIHDNSGTKTAKYDVIFNVLRL
jgi:hypothetical protein